MPSNSPHERENRDFWMTVWMIVLLTALCLFCAWIANGCKYIDQLPVPSTTSTTVTPPTSTTQPRPWEVPNYDARYDCRDLMGTNCPVIMSGAWTPDRRAANNKSTFYPDRVTIRNAENEVLYDMTPDVSGNLWFLRRDVSTLPIMFWIDFHLKGARWVYHVKDPASRDALVLKPVQVDL